MVTGPACMLESGYQAGLVLRPTLSRRVLLRGAEPPACESHPVVLCCHLLLGPWQVLRAPKCSAARMCAWHRHGGLAWEGLWHPAAGAPFPLFNIRFDLPLAIVSKDQRMSITF